MKLFKTSIIVLSMALSFTVAADDIYNKIVSGQLVQIKQAAQQMTAGQGQNQQNLDAMAEFLHAKYKNPITSEVDTLAWITKALARSGDGRYQKLLEDVSRQSLQKKLRKYAAKAADSLPEGATDLFVAGEVNLQQAKKVVNSTVEKLVPKANLSESERQLFAIASGDLHVIKQLAQRLEADGNGSELVYDGLAQYLLTHAKSVYDHNLDTLAWICRALEGSKNGRYSNVVKEVKNTTNAKKLRKYADNALDNLPKSENPYQFGTVNFKEVLEKYKA